ncbi:MAG: PEP-CTERM sorting domain-containing protein [Planctomycetales bacterium]|nr:PEP-CTERM sorting domain-containing protein [Planctomycetales bacterium]
MKHTLKLTAAVMIAACGLFGLPAQSSAIEIAESLIVDLDASTFNSGDLSWANAGSYDDFDAVNAPLRISIEGTPAVYLNGSQAFSGFNPAPEGIVGLDPTRTIEAWVFNPSIASEETVVSWGHRGGPAGTNMSFNYGNHGNYGAVGHWDAPDLGWINNDPDYTAGAPEANQWHLLTYTYDGEVTRVYADGELWNEEETLLLYGGLNTYDDTAIAIGSQWDSVDVLTGALKASMAYGRVRVHDGVLSDSQIAANYASEKDGFKSPLPPGPAVPQPIPTGPIHRYSFSNAAGDATDAVLVDSVGGEDGVVRGDGAIFDGSSLVLPGGTSDIAPYGDLPNGLISKLTDATIETWYTLDGAQNWGRVFDFGSTDVGGEGGELDEPGGGGEGLDYLQMSTSRGTDTTVARLEMRDEDPRGGGVTTVDVVGPGDAPSDLTHITVVYDSDGSPFTGGATLSVYQNGELIGSGDTQLELGNINDVNNWLGRSNWTADSNVQGSFDEFRIYDYALDKNQVLGNYEAGPDTVNIGGGGLRGDFNNDGILDAADIDALTGESASGANNLAYDLTGDSVVDGSDVAEWIKADDIKKSWIGDANLDGEFNTSDLVVLFSGGKYETGEAAVWSTGDFTGDGLFTTSDLVSALSDGGYEAGTRAAVAAVPEPASATLLLLGSLAMLRRRRK